MKKTLKRTGAIGLAAATIVTGLSFGPAAATASSPSDASTTALPEPGSSAKVVSPVGNGKYYGGLPSSPTHIQQYATKAAADAASAGLRIDSTGEGWFRAVVRDGSATGECLSIFPMTGGDTLHTKSCSGTNTEWSLDAQGRMVNRQSGQYVTNTVRYVDAYKRSYFAMGSSGPAAEFEGIEAGLSAKVDSTDIPNRTAGISGWAVPGSYVVINGEDQVQAGTDGKWSYELTELKLGSNPVTLEQYEGTVKTGETTLDAELKVAPVTGVASFPADHGQNAVLSGTAQPGATIVIRDVNGDEIARTEARLGSGTWSTPITAPNAGGDYDVRVHQEIDDEATGEIIVAVAYGAAVVITAPVEGMAHDGGPVTLRGTGEVGAQIAVREQGRSTVLGTAQVLANGQWTVRTANVDDRKHVLEATQSGKGNNTTASTVTLNPENDTAAPADLTLTSHEDGDTFAQPGTTTLSGKATPKATVTAYWFGKDYAQYATTVVANDEGDYAISRNMGGTQPYNITLTQTAQAGKVNEVTVRLVPAGVGPVDLTVGSHQDGDAFAPTGQTTISGKASSGATVTFYWFGKDYPQYATTTVA
ncbi:Ig-like domain-containing protein, partial [Frigoribacterium sp. Leaf44]|uniref:Ig-like domain-containing protein n=1 Tax=Frigoribacterium sp. Leaf44 TaxID=1736220 RepID=UPI00138F54C3